MTDTLSLDQQSVTTNLSPAHVLQIRNFRMLWMGEGISLLGDQFYMIALPWLVLSLTGNALAGALIGLNAAVLLICAGILMTLFTLSAAFSPAVRAGME